MDFDQRDALVTVMVSHADTAATGDDELIVAEQTLQRIRCRPTSLAKGAGLSSAQPGLAGALGSVLAAVVELAQSGQWDRIKACRNCHHSVVDQSRSASATFCRTSCKSQAGMRLPRPPARRRRAVSGESTVFVGGMTNNSGIASQRRERHGLRDARHLVVLSSGAPAVLVRNRRSCRHALDDARHDARHGRFGLVSTCA